LSPDFNVLVPVDPLFFNDFFSTLVEKPSMLTCEAPFPLFSLTTFSLLTQGLQPASTFSPSPRVVVSLLKWLFLVDLFFLWEASSDFSRSAVVPIRFSAFFFLFYFPSDKSTT